jgi:hypothetical protein
MALGSAKSFSLEQAREKARKCRQLLHNGIDPLEHRRAERASAAAVYAKSKRPTPSFEIARRRGVQRAIAPTGERAEHIGRDGSSIVTSSPEAYVPR